MLCQGGLRKFVSDGQEKETFFQVTSPRLRHLAEAGVSALAEIEEEKGPEALRHKGTARKWLSEEKLDLVTKVIAGASIKSVAIEAGINNGLLYQWLRRYKDSGYNGLINQKKGSPSKKPDMKEKVANKTKKLEESEYEELVRLRAENEYIKTEIEVLKKEIALREEKWDEQLKARKQKSSVNSGKMDTN